MHTPTNANKTSILASDPKHDFKMKTTEEPKEAAAAKKKITDGPKGMILCRHRKRPEYSAAKKNKMESKLITKLEAKLKA